MGESPAFQFYPADWVMGTLLFSLAEEGAYLRCVMHQWNTGSVPGDDVLALARVMRVTPAEARKLWPIVREKFERGDDGTWRNERLERERQKQLAYRESQAQNGRRSAAAKAQRNANHRATTVATVVPIWLQPTGQPTGQPNSTLQSSSSSSSSKPSSTQNVELGHTARALAPIRHPSPLDWDRQHGKHVTGFCDWVCLPQAVCDEFVRRVIGAGADELQASMHVLEWATGVRRAWTGRIPGADIFAFWRHEWAAAHESNAPAPVGQMSHGDAVREALRRV